MAKKEFSNFNASKAGNKMNRTNTNNLLIEMKI